MWKNSQFYALEEDGALARQVDSASGGIGAEISERQQNSQPKSCRFT